MGRDGADQHRLPLAVLAGHDVEHLVDAVAEVHVRHAARSEHHARPRGRPESGVARGVLGTQVRLGLDDEAGASAVHERAADQRARDRARVAAKELGGQSLQDAEEPSSTPRPGSHARSSVSRAA